MSRDRYNITEEDLRNYLLGRVSEGTRDRIDDLTFSDAAFLETVRTAKSDLIEDYQSGRLDQASRSAVERLILSTRDGKREAAIAAGLRAEYRNRSQSSSESRWQQWLRLFGSPAFSLVSLAGMAILALLYVNASKRVTELTAREARLQEAVQSAESRLRVLQQGATSGPMAIVARIPAFNVFPDEHVRGGGATNAETIRIGPEIRAIDLRFHINAASRPGYIGRVRRSADPRILWQGKAVDRNESSVMFRVPASVFATAGRYRLILHGGGDARATEVLAETNFSVELAPSEREK